MKQLLFDFMEETEEDISQVSLAELIKDKEYQDILFLVLEKLNKVQTEKDELEKRVEQMKVARSRYLENLEHDHDELVNLRIVVEELQSKYESIPNNKTWLGQLFFRD